MSALGSHLIQSLGPLRLALALAAIVTILLMPEPGTGIVLDGWDIFTTLVIPALAPLLIAVYLLDVLMALVLRREQPAPDRRRYTTVIVSDLALTAMLLVAFLPIILALRR
jgi:hypothetical protein